jgi:hypothetical protein
VGTGGFGDAAFDRRDLVTAGFDRAVEMQALGSDSPDLALSESQAAFFLLAEPRIKYQDDRLWIDYEERVEMQACALWRVFRVIPEMPALELIGSDYMTKDLAWQTSLPVLFHTRKVVHQYTAGRRQQESTAEAATYALRDVRYLQMGRVWSIHNRAIVDRWQGLDKFDKSEYCQSFREAAMAARLEMKAVRERSVDVYRTASFGLDGALAGRLSHIADTIESAGDRLEQSVHDAVDDFADLVGAWDELCASAAALGEELWSLADIQSNV